MHESDESKKREDRASRHLAMANQESAKCYYGHCYQGLRGRYGGAVQMQRYSRDHGCDKANHEYRRRPLRGGEAAHRHHRRKVVKPNERVPDPRQDAFGES